MLAQRLTSNGSFSWRAATGEIVCSEPLYRILAFERGTRVTPELIGARVHPDDLTGLCERFEQCRLDGRDVESEFRLLMPDRSVKCLRLTAHGCRREGQRLEYIGTVEDVTERWLAGQALDKARSELADVAIVLSLGALGASIVHEISQPLSGIVTNASTCLKMLAGDPPNIAGARETARRTIRDVGRASELIARWRALFTERAKAPLDPSA